MGLIRLWQEIEALALSVCEHVLDVFGLLDLWQIAELLEGHENTIEAGRPGALTLPDENTLRAKKNYDRDDPGRIFTEAVPSGRGSQDFAGPSGCHRTPRHATRDPAGTAVSDPRSMIKLARLSWRRAHPSHLAGRDAAASHQRSR